MRRKRVCSKESKGLRKWHQAQRHSWASSQRPGCRWPLGGRLHRRKIISHACSGSWGHRLCWLVGTRVGGRWPLRQALMSVMASFCVVLRGSCRVLLPLWAWSWNTTEVKMVSLTETVSVVNTEALFLTVWCWPNKGSAIKGVVVQCVQSWKDKEGRKRVSHGV